MAGGAPAVGALGQEVDACAAGRLDDPSAPTGPLTVVLLLLPVLFRTDGGADTQGGRVGVIGRE